MSRDIWLVYSNKIAEETRIKKRWKEERDEFKRKLEKAYAREVMLINRLHELETELAQYKNGKGVKLATTRN